MTASVSASLGRCSSKRGTEKRLYIEIGDEDFLSLKGAF